MWFPDNQCTFTTGCNQACSSTIHTCIHLREIMQQAYVSRGLMGK